MKLYKSLSRSGGAARNVVVVAPNVVIVRVRSGDVDGSPRRRSAVFRVLLRTSGQVVRPSRRDETESVGLVRDGGRSFGPSSAGSDMSDVDGDLIMEGAVMREMN